MVFRAFGGLRAVESEVYDSFVRKIHHFFIRCDSSFCMITRDCIKALKEKTSAHFKYMPSNVYPQITQLYLFNIYPFKIRIFRNLEENSLPGYLWWTQSLKLVTTSEKITANNAISLTVSWNTTPWNKTPIHFWDFSPINKLKLYHSMHCITKVNWW